MKNTIKYAIFLIILVNNAHADIIDDILSMVQRFQTRFCQKASIQAPSIQSFDGARCATDLGASIAKIVCEGYEKSNDKFAGSNCDKMANGRRILNGEIAKVKLTNMLNTDRQTPQRMCSFITSILPFARLECDRTVRIARLSEETEPMGEIQRKLEETKKRLEPLALIAAKKKALKAQLEAERVSKQQAQMKELGEAKGLAKLIEEGAMEAQKERQATAALRSKRAQKMRSTLQKTYEESSEEESD